MPLRFLRPCLRIDTRVVAEGNAPEGRLHPRGDPENHAYR